MARAPFQVLVFPYRFLSNGDIEYAVFKRADSAVDFWQGIAGGGEELETPLEAAKREAYEEGGIKPESSYMALDSVASIPVEGIRGFLWGNDLLVIPEHCFGVEVKDQTFRLSHEHSEFRWVGYDSAVNLLKYDSNKNALWELNLRLQRQSLSQ